MNDEYNFFDRRANFYSFFEKNKRYETFNERAEDIDCKLVQCNYNYTKKFEKSHLLDDLDEFNKKDQTKVNDLHSLFFIKNDLTNFLNSNKKRLFEYSNNSERNFKIEINRTDDLNVYQVCGKKSKKLYYRTAPDIDIYLVGFLKYSPYGLVLDFHHLAGGWTNR